MRSAMLGILIIGVLSTTAGAVPRYSIMYGQSCVLCHVDPSGSGSRSLYGAQFFAYSDLAMKGLPMEELGKIQPMLNDQIQVGVDARTQFYMIDTTGNNTIMQMQGNLYLTFQLNPKWTFYLNKGLYQGFEAWGMGHILPWNGYIKVGRGTPPYGLRLADHKSFVREPLKLGMGWYETGVEIGFHPERFNLQVMVTNGTDVATQDFVPFKKTKAVTGRADVRLALMSVNIWLGISGRYNENQVVSTLEVDRLGGVYGGLSLGRLFLVGELDYHHNTQPAAVKEICSYLEISYLITRGLLIRAEHDFHDPNIDVTSGTENMIVVGAEIVPTGFLQIIPNVRYHDLTSGPDWSGNDYIESEVQLHIFF